MLISYLAYISTLKWRRHVYPNYWLTFNGLHSVIFQKTQLFKCRVLRFCENNLPCVTDEYEQMVIPYYGLPMSNDFMLLNVFPEVTPLVSEMEKLLPPILSLM